MSTRLRTVLVAAAAAIALTAAGGHAAAGGWANTTLDEMPAPVAGETTEIGFTIRQHGVTPVDIEPGSGPVGITITDAAGTSTFFTAEGDGTIGHYVAAVTFPAEGDYIWSVSQGWFAPQELGSITVASGSGGSGSFGWLPPASTLTAALAAICAAVAIGDALVSRRRRHLQPA